MELLQLLLDVLPSAARVLPQCCWCWPQHCLAFVPMFSLIRHNGRAVSSFWCWPWLLWRCSSGGFAAENSAAIPEANAPSADSAA